MEDNGRYYYWKKDRKNLLFDTQVSIGDTVDIDAFYSQFKTSEPYFDTIIKQKIVINSIRIDNTNRINNDSIRIFNYDFVDISQVPVLIGGSYYGEFRERLIESYGDHNRDILAIHQNTGIPEGIDYIRCFSSDSFQYKRNFLNRPNCEYDFMSMINSVDQECMKVRTNYHNKF